MILRDFILTVLCRGNFKMSVSFVEGDCKHERAFSSSCLRKCHSERCLYIYHIYRSRDTEREDCQEVEIRYRNDKRKGNTYMYVWFSLLAQHCPSLSRTRGSDTANTTSYR